MTCDPMAVQRPDLPFPYSLFGTDQYPHLDFDHGPVLTERQTAATHIGCIFLRCDESGGFDCAEGFRCDVASAPPTTTGCAGIPCGELGRCSGDEYICEPTSPQPRPSMVDAHGCATKNCEEGVVCPVSTECDFTRPGLGIGCAYIRCDEPGGSCPREDFKCDPDPAPVPSGQTAVPDSYGCVPEHCALDDYVCPVDMVCDPTNPLGTLAGCAPPKPPDPETGGTGGTGGTTNGGTGGTSGTSGAGAGAPSGGVSGSTGAGGTTSDPSTPGVCR
jgi:hypothetical protein